MKQTIIYFKLSIPEAVRNHTAFKDGTCYSNFDKASDVLLFCVNEVKARINEYSKDYHVFVSEYHHRLLDNEESYQLTFRHGDFHYIYNFGIRKHYLFIEE